MNICCEIGKVSVYLKQNLIVSDAKLMHFFFYPFKLFSSYHDMINTLRRTNQYLEWRKPSLFGTLELVFLFLSNHEEIKSRRRIFCFSITFYWVAKVAGSAHQKVVIKLVEVPSYCRLVTSKRESIKYTRDPNVIVIGLFWLNNVF